jgi:hypothetical protein
MHQSSVKLCSVVFGIEKPPQAGCQMFQGTLFRA